MAALQPDAAAPVAQQPTTPQTNSSSSSSSSLFAVPAPIRRLFSHFPLHTYDSEALPSRAPDYATDRQIPRLYIFACDGDGEDRVAAAGVDAAPSFNPSCLKWQTFLRIAGVEFCAVPSNNHASPSGALPFLLPAASASKPSPAPLTGDKIRLFAKEHASSRTPPVSDASASQASSSRVEAYRALMAQNVRPAWLHALYLNPTNHPLLSSLYLPSSPLLSAPLGHTVRAAASAEILKTTRRAAIHPAQLRADLVSALRALSALLGDDQWFFQSASSTQEKEADEGKQEGGEAAVAGPGLFDAEVFAYTYLILDEGLGWRDGWMGECVREFGNLVRHKERLYERCWGRAST